MFDVLKFASGIIAGLGAPVLALDPMMSDRRFLRAVRRYEYAKAKANRHPAGSKAVKKASRGQFGVAVLR